MPRLPKMMRYALFCLAESFDSLDSIKESILKKTHKEKLQVKGVPQVTDDDNFYYYSKFSDLEEDVVNLHLNSLKDENFTVTPGDDFKFIKTYALCEFSTRQKLNKTNGEILPKENRLNLEETEIIFVEHEERVYVIAFTTTEQTLKRIKALIEDSNISQDDIETTPTSDLFHWLFYKYSNTRIDLGSNIKLQSIKGFTGIVMDNTNTFIGKSENTTDLIVTKSFVSCGYPITAMKIKLTTGNGILTFFTNTDAELVVEGTSSIGLVDLDSSMNYAVPILLYFLVFPTLQKLFYTERFTFLSEEQTDFNKKIGIEAIEFIAKQNNLNIEFKEI